MYKLKKIPLLLSVLLLFLQGCSGNDITASDMQGKKFFYQVSDAYSTSNYTLEELEELKKNSSFIDNLQKFNTELNSTDTVDFYDMKYDTVDFIGKWNKPKDLANGYGHKDLTDQEVTIKGKSEYITPVNTFILNQKTMQKLGLNYLSDQDFIYNGEFPMVLGSGFKEYYNIGDTIPITYLREKFNGKVVGFYDKDLVFDEFSHCDSYSTVIVPYMDNLESKDDYEDREGFFYRYNLFKNLAYIYFPNTVDYEKNKDAVEKIAQKYNLDYTVLRGY
ncbi:hypothetical protein HMPREF9970_1192 [Lachnoanaerobaculum saburreum F0468]|jgi:lipoprotein|uniref:Lipoprotein n=1 Tax=Lachnoanaerobaculum saburreum F0468 TaxID=1095750 RepID=I0R9K9_9FIRM|nr:hypothetical protein [Lachnoanaerobaculum saburreum]EIC96367.1 hypothetical protein HMPREF9970_1192 [Lachnoanaerobaculum saburreum F0468]